MRIAFVEDNFLRWELGDAIGRSNVTSELLLTQWESFIDTYAGALTARGHTCVKFVPSIDNRERTVYQHRLGHQVITIPCWRFPGPLKQLGWRAGVITFTRRMLRDPLAQGCDVIHYNSIYSSFFLGSSVIPRAIPRTVQHSGGSFPYRPRSVTGALIMPVLRRSLRRCRGILVNTPNTLTRIQIEFLKKRAGVRDEQLLSFGGIGIDQEIFRDLGVKESRTKLNIDQGKLVLVAIGGIVAESSGRDLMNKNQFALVRLFRRVKGQLEKAELHVVGGGAAINQLRDLVAELDLDSSVKIHGVVPHAQIPVFISAADLVVVPIGVFDFYGVTAIQESFACGRPVCAFAMNPSVPKDVFGGLVVDPASDLSPSQMVNALRNPEFLAEKAREGGEVVKEYLLEPSVSRLESIFAGLGTHDS